jgi:hypothetical protein
MRKIRIFAHVSLDGVIAPGGPNEDSDYAHGGWMAPYRSAAGAEAIAEAQAKASICCLAAGLTISGPVIGRRSYRSVCRQSERGDEVRRDAQAGQSRMGSG